MGIRDSLRRLTRKFTTHAGSGDPTHRQAAAAQEAVQLAQYRYLLRVASPELLEHIHVEAFAGLTPEQRERVFLRLGHNLPEGQQPANSEPAELARASVAAHQDDHGYLVRMLRRPGQGVSEGHAVPAGPDGPGDSLFAGSVLDPVAAVAARSEAATQALVGFDNSPEAAQVNASIFVHPTGPTGVPVGNPAPAAACRAHA
jgi:hypothetical protein